MGDVRAVHQSCVFFHDDFQYMPHRSSGGNVDLLDASGDFRLRVVRVCFVLKEHACYFMTRCFVNEAYPEIIDVLGELLLDMCV